MLPADPIWQDMLATSLLDHRPVHFFSSTSSTNTEAMQLGLAGAPAGTLVVAETQTEGRGRRGRPWLSPTGAGLYFSLILRPMIDPADLPKITLAAGVAACRAIETLTGLNPMIKWPNDLLLSNRKFAGILTETAPLPAQGPPMVIVGVGININTKADQFPENLRDKITSLALEKGASLLRGPLLAAVVAEIVRGIKQLELVGFAQIRSDFSVRDFTFGRTLTWLTPDSRKVEGEGVGIDAEGLLHIRDAAGLVHEVLSGDVTLAKGP